VTVIHDVLLLTAVQVHVLVVETVTVPEPPLAAIFSVVGVTV
jgi:hypothetical protein